MGIFDFFKTEKAPSKDRLVQQFKQIQHRREELAHQADEIRRNALLGDGASDFSRKLAKVRDEEELLQLADQEVERMMRALLAAEVEANHAKLPQEREQYQKRYEAASVQAGEQIAQACSTLAGIAEPWSTSLAQSIREAFEKIATHEAYSEKVVALKSGFAHDAHEVEYFAGWKTRIQTAEKLVPGSAEAEKWIDGRVKVLLFKPAPPAAPEPYRKGGFLRGGMYVAKTQIDPSFLQNQHKSPIIGGVVKR